VKALIRFYFHQEVGDDADKLCKAWGELKFALQFHGKLTIKEAIKG